MLTWLSRVLNRLLWGAPLVRDADGRYLSAAGRAYEVNVEPLQGSDRALVVTLAGGPVVPGTFIPSLSVHCGTRPRQAEAAIRTLLDGADAAEARFAPARERYQWDEPEPEEIDLESLTGAEPSTAEVLTPPGFDFEDEDLANLRGAPEPLAPEEES